MSRDSESLIEILICILIATAFAAGAGSKQWTGSLWAVFDTGVTTEFVQAENSVDQPDRVPFLNKPARAISPNHAAEIQRISDLIELNHRLFAKPVDAAKHKTARQSC